MCGDAANGKIALLAGSRNAATPVTALTDRWRDQVASYAYVGTFIII